MEEDIKILEDFIDGARCINIKGELTGGFCDCQRYVEENTYQALENLIKEYNKVREGRNWLSERISAQIATPELFDRILEENYISKSRIRKLLDIQYELFNSKNQKEYSQEVVNVLEELLEEE